MKKVLISLFIIGLICFQCTSVKKADTTNIKEVAAQMAVRMADSEMVFFPQCSMVDFTTEGKWNYTAGLIASSMMELWKDTKDEKYYNYAKGYADEFINADGEIIGYNKDEFNIDKINSGKFLFDLYKVTKDERYKKAIYILRDQLSDQPRTSEGGFWHKKRYTSQMWLDGLYMGTPFYAQFAKEFGSYADFDDVINQFVIVQKHTYDPVVGLNYHGWDERKEQKWANQETGCSPNFWGRAMGWYAMALVDALDYIPEDHPEREKLLEILRLVAAGIEKYQDKSSGLWYQVLDKGGMEGNYEEASVSCMFVYSLKKAVRMNYIDKKYAEIAEIGYVGLLEKLIKKNEDGTISLTKVCAMAGLGGSPYRDGTYEYYINETVRDNDPKGVGPFILASLEMKK